MSSVLIYKINVLRQELDNLYQAKGNFQDQEVLKKSIELDKLIIEFLKESELAPPLK
ncbi:MAG: aspartyl-phosphate phosphatase Spo0E family protein [Bacillota bacterium]